TESRLQLCSDDIALTQSLLVREHEADARQCSIEDQSERQPHERGLEQHSGNAALRRRNAERKREQRTHDTVQGADRRTARDVYGDVARTPARLERITSRLRQDERREYRPDQPRQRLRDDRACQVLTRAQRRYREQQRRDRPERER